MTKLVYVIVDKETGGYYYRGHSSGASYELNSFEEDFRVFSNYAGAKNCVKQSNFLRENPERFEIVALTLDSSPVTFKIPEPVVHNNLTVDEAVDSTIKSLSSGEEFTWKTVKEWVSNHYSNIHFPEVLIRQALNKHKRNYHDFIYSKVSKKNRKI